MGFKIKKTVNGETVWEPIKAKKYTASKTIEYTDTFPITINANGEPLIDYRIYGNTEQTGTPTPENHIMPIGCGERVDITGLSEPLCGIKTYTDRLDLSTGILTRRIKKLVLTGEENWVVSSSWKKTNTSVFYFSVLDIGGASLYEKYIFSTHFAPKTRTELYQDDIEGIGKTGNDAVTIRVDDTIATTVTDFKAWLRDNNVTIWYILAEPDVSTISIPSGLTGTIEGYLIQDSTPTPETPIYPTANGVKQADGTYIIPYGYKLPILSNSTVTNIYLGEVQTTRRIKKLVLTGNETIWQKNIDISTSNSYAIRISDYYTSLRVGLCSHYATVYNTSANEGVYFGLGINFLTAVSDEIDTVDKWKSYLATQYAAGTPVTVWYVLAEPETGIVNDPLMKIGDYTDTVSMEQAGVSIPTNNGSTAIDYNGTLKPSQMYIKYNSWSGWSDIDNYKMVNGDWVQGSISGVP